MQAPPDCRCMKNPHPFAGNPNFLKVYIILQGAKVIQLCTNYIGCMGNSKFYSLKIFKMFSITISLLYQVFLSLSLGSV